MVKLLNLSTRFVCCILVHGDQKVLLVVMSFWEHWFYIGSHSTLSSKRDSWWHSLAIARGPWMGWDLSWPNHNEEELIYSFSLFRSEQEAQSPGCYWKPSALISQPLVEPDAKMTGCSNREKWAVDDLIPWWLHHAWNLLTSRFQLFSDIFFQFKAVWVMVLSLASESLLIDADLLNCHQEIDDQKDVKIIELQKQVIM